MIPLPLLKLLEAPLNRVLALDPASAPRLRALNGKALAVELPFGRYVFEAVDDRLGFADDSVTPAITLRGSVADFLQLAQSNGQQAGAVQVQGDVGAAQKWQQFFADLQPDFEAPLAGLLGDVAAPLIVNVLRALQNWGRQAAAAAQAAAVEYVQEEARLVVSRAELAQFAGAVDVLRDDAERLLARARARGLM